MRRNKKGFTLIELLIVIAIIGILSAVVLLVLDPAAQKTKANETVLRSNVDKICLAFGACKMASITGAAGDCDLITELGITTPTVPTGATYNYNGVVAGTWAGRTLAAGTCTFYCHTTTNLVTQSGTACLIQ